MCDVTRKLVPDSCATYPHKEGAGLSVEHKAFPINGRHDVRLDSYFAVRQRLEMSDTSGDIEKLVAARYAIAKPLYDDELPEPARLHTLAIKNPTQDPNQQLRRWS
jgi:hypothetical protein